ncbi:MAG: hypothetical protein QM730_05950 [Anaerolineales bacterium]
MITISRSYSAADRSACSNFPRHIAALADNGNYTGNTSILDIHDADGTLLYQPESKPARQVLDPRVAWLISDILSDDYARITGFGLDSTLKLDRTAAVKTGTTTNFHDNWTIGYTLRSAGRRVGRQQRIRSHAQRYRFDRCRAHLARSHARTAAGHNPTSPSRDRRDWILCKFALFLDYFPPPLAKILMRNGSSRAPNPRKRIPLINKSGSIR